jgi:gliding motility-associated-like protein
MRILVIGNVVRNTRLIFIKLCILILLYSVADAQNIPIRNPSLEGPVADYVAPPEWFVDDGIVAIYGPLGHHLTASDSNTYVYMHGQFDKKKRVHLPASIGQRLVPDLKVGRTYKFSFDYAFPKADTNATFGTLMIKGADWVGQDLYWKSGRVYKDSWQRDTIYFTPARVSSFIMFSTYGIAGDKSEVGILLDHFSDIEEILTMKVSSETACPGASDGAVSVVVDHADSSYTYLWQPGNYTTSSVKNLPAGAYRVVIKGDGMTAEAKIVVPESEFNMNATVTGISCYGQSDGIVNMGATGGVEPYRYSLNNDYNTTGIFSNISPGTYNIQIEDQLKCKLGKTIDILEPPPLQLEKVSTRDVLCSSARNGQIILSASGGTPPYTYAVPGYVTQSDSILRRLEAGNQHYTITDSHNCLLEGNTFIAKDSREGAVYAPNAFSPNGDGINDIFHVKLLDDIRDYRMAVYNRWGTVVFQTGDPAAGWDGQLHPAGTYVWMVTYTDSRDQLIKQTGSLLMIR